MDLSPLEQFAVGILLAFASIGFMALLVLCAAGIRYFGG